MQIPFIYRIKLKISGCQDIYIKNRRLGNICLKSYGKLCFLKLCIIFAATKRSAEIIQNKGNLRQESKYCIQNLNKEWNGDWNIFD